MNRPVRTTVLAAAAALTGSAALAVGPDFARCSMERALGVEHGTYGFVTLLEKRGAQNAAMTAYAATL